MRPLVLAHGGLLFSHRVSTVTVKGGEVDRAQGRARRTAHSGRAIALEDLTHLRSRVRLKRSQRRTHSSWAYADLRAKIAYKAAMAGVVVVFVDPRHTSQTCSACGHCARANR